ncbi:MAG: hypothetical protein HYY24_11420, partial [Verrucomicrobia bacterium]|nr:hypothetical protein [Verrucomicrobiota bacterium]
SNLGGGAVINNLAGAVLEAQGEVDFAHNFESPGSAIHNAGLFSKTGGGETVLSSATIALNNTGTVEIVEGTLRLDGGGSLGGAIGVEAAGVLNLNNGTFVIPAGSTLGGVGALALSGGSAVFEETLAFTSALTISGGAWTFNANQSFASLTQSGGVLRGTGTVTATGTLAWTDGAMRDGGKTLIAAGASGTISGGGSKDLAANRVLENAGTLVVSGGTVFFNQSNLGGGAVINNLAGAVLEAQGEVDFSHNFESPGSAINNAGIFRKTGGGETRLSSSTVALNNSGTVSVESGTLRLEAGGVHSGGWEVVSTGTLVLAGGTHTFNAGTAFQGDGTLRIQTPVTLATDIDLGGLQVVFESSASVAGVFQISNTPGGTITFDKSMTIPGSVKIAGAMTLSTASLIVTINGTLTLEASGVLNNPGTVRAGLFVNNGGTINGNAPGQIGGASLSALRIDEIRVVGSGAASVKSQRAEASDREVLLRWSAKPGEQFVVEVSLDLARWSVQAAAVREVKPGQYEGNVKTAGQSPAFFRLRTAEDAQPLEAQPAGEENTP